MRPPGELIYLSERKLLDLAVHFGVDAGWSETRVAVTGSGGVRLPLVPGAGVSGSVGRSSERVDPLRERRARARALEQVVAALEKKRPLSHLDRAGMPTERPLTQLDWFRFQRPLRFGVGNGDSDHSVRALVLVDEHAVEREDPQPALLMTGAPHHLQDPYAYDRPDDVAGARSGSGTDELFCWLRDVWLTLDADQRAGLGGPAHELFRANPIAERPAMAYEMYSLFAREDWMKPRFRDIRRTAMCEGVGIVSLIAAPDHGLPSVVMGSPLYVRVCAPQRDDALSDEARPRNRLFRRRRDAS